LEYSKRVGVMLIELLEDVASLPIIFALLYIVVLTIVEIGKGLTTGRAIKMFICMIFTVAIIISTSIILSLELFQIATIWKEYEVDNVLDPRVKSLSFTAIELIWSLICVGLLFLLWKFVYFHQIISGVGSVKDRLKNKINWIKGW